jgi:hypothetical protein
MDRDTRLTLIYTAILSIQFHPKNGLIDKYQERDKVIESCMDVALQANKLLESELCQ